MLLLVVVPHLRRSAAEAVQPVSLQRPATGEQTAAAPPPVRGLDAAAFHSGKRVAFLAPLAVPLWCRTHKVLQEPVKEDRLADAGEDWRGCRQP